MPEDHSLSAARATHTPSGRAVTGTFGSGLLEPTVSYRDHPRQMCELKSRTDRCRLLVHGAFPTVAKVTMDM